VHTELGRSQVEVQRCTLSSDWRRVGKATVDVEVEAEVVEEMLAEEDQEEQEEDS